jgi:hypothetical protein
MFIFPCHLQRNFSKTPNPQHMTSVETPNQKILTFLTFSEGAEAAVNLYVSLFLKGYLC